MGKQISIQLSDTMYSRAIKHAKKKGFDSLQEFIRETMRTELYEPKNGLLTALASEKSLAKLWLSKEEEGAWKHLQKDQ